MTQAYGGPKQKIRNSTTGRAMVAKGMEVLAYQEQHHDDELVAADSQVVDSLELLLRDIRRVPLLGPDEQIALARRVKVGDSHAKQQMVTANLRLVVSIA